MLKRDKSSYLNPKIEWKDSFDIVKLIDSVLNLKKKKKHPPVDKTIIHFLSY